MHQSMDYSKNLLIKTTHEKDRQWSVDKWSVFGGLFYFIKEGLLKCGLYLLGSLYSEVVYNIGLTVFGMVIYSVVLHWLKVDGCQLKFHITMWIFFQCLCIFLFTN